MLGNGNEEACETLFWSIGELGLVIINNVA